MQYLQIHNIVPPLKDCTSRAVQSLNRRTKIKSKELQSKYAKTVINTE